jgi:hypothetical protein
LDADGKERGDRQDGTHADLRSQAAREIESKQNTDGTDSTVARARLRDLQKVEQRAREIGDGGRRLIREGLDIGADQEREKDPVKDGDGQKTEPAEMLETLLVSPHEVLTTQTRCPAKYGNCGAEGTFQA